MYVLNATDAMGCVSSDTIQVTVYQNPVGIIVSSEGTQLCNGQSTVLSVTELFYAFEWGNGSTSQAIQVDQGGTYDVEVTDLNGCKGLSTITLFYPNFGISVSDDTLCQGETVQLTAIGATQVTWFNGETNASIALTPTADLTCMVELKKWSCTETLSVQIHVLPISQAPIDTLYYTDASTNIVLNAPKGFSSYNWIPSTFLSSAYDAAPVFDGSQTTLYVLSSVNEHSCSRSDTIRVVVLDLNIPSGFSPNGDQVNDVFVMEELTDLPVRFSVFNRWGEEVFSSDRYEQNWDGRCQSSRCPQKEALPEGTYFYSIEVYGLKRSGYIALKR
jgi:gliding motility-associated-like protein